MTDEIVGNDEIVKNADAEVQSSGQAPSQSSAQSSADSSKDPSSEDAAESAGNTAELDTSAAVLGNPTTVGDLIESEESLKNAGKSNDHGNARPSSGSSRTGERQKISDLKARDEVQGIYHIKHIALMESRDGRKYLNLIFSDATGDVEGRIWNQCEEIYKKFNKYDFARLVGKVNMFQGRRQIIATEIDRVDESEVDLNEFVVRTGNDPEEMYSKLLGHVASLDDVYIRDLLKSILDDTEISRRLKIWQAGKTIHHAYQGGLLEHILSCTELAVSLSGHYGANVNYVVAGAVLHDLGKIYELTDGINVDYTEEGKLVGHLIKAIEIIDRFAYRIQNFPHQVRTHVKHIVLSHHGEYEYGSPKLPQTSEAYLVHMIDVMDSRMNTIETIKRVDHTPGHWSGYVRHLDRVIYKGELPFYDSYDAEPRTGRARQSRPRSGAIEGSLSGSTQSGAGAGRRGGNTSRRSPRANEKNSRGGTGGQRKGGARNKELKQSLGDFLKDIQLDGSAATGAGTEES